MYILFVYHSNSRGEFYEFSDKECAKLYQDLFELQGRSTKLVKVK